MGLSESEEQRVLMEWTEWLAPRVPELGYLFHIPNGGLRNKATAARMRAEGVKAGVPDLFLPVARQGFHGLFIEMKRREGGRVSTAQAEWIFWLSQMGYACRVARGADEAMNILREYLGLNEE